MRDFQRQFRISSRSLPEITEAIDTIVARYGGSRSVEFRGRKLSNEAFINAAIVHLASLPLEEQEHVLASAVKRLEALMKGEEPGEVKREDGQAPTVQGPPLMPPEGKPRRKRG